MNSENLKPDILKGWQIFKDSIFWFENTIGNVLFSLGLVVLHFFKTKTLCMRDIWRYIIYWLCSFFGQTSMALCTNKSEKDCYILSEFIAN